MANLIGNYQQNQCDHLQMCYFVLQPILKYWFALFASVKQCLENITYHGADFLGMHSCKGHFNHVSQEACLPIYIAHLNGITVFLVLNTPGDDIFEK